MKNNDARNYPALSSQIRAIAPKAFVNVGDPINGGDPGMMYAILYSSSYNDRALMREHGQQICEILKGKRAPRYNECENGIIIDSYLFVKPNCEIVE
jgi:hypothetical protein